MVNLEELHKKVLTRIPEVTDELLRPYLKDVEQGGLDDIRDDLYYKYLTALAMEIKPWQIVELGAAAGGSALMFLAGMPKDSKLYSCTLPEPEGEWRWIKEEYPNLVKVRGNDLDRLVWQGTNCYLPETDVWFIDTSHTYSQVKTELEHYGKFFKEGCLVLMDDIKLNDGMYKAWLEIEYQKLDVSELHHSGFGLLVV